MPKELVVALIAAGASLLVACITGIFTWRNGSKANKNATDIEGLKGAVNRDLARLQAKLEHGQVISSTQWNAEFNAYQAIWKGMVALRTTSTKVVFRESEFGDLGISVSFLAPPVRIENTQALIEKFAQAASQCLSAIHDNAPFYPAPIRTAANDAHLASMSLLKKQLAALLSPAHGNDAIANERLASECQVDLTAIIQGVNFVEALIRERFAAIEVLNTVRN